MPRGWFSGPGVGVLDARYLMLDCTNDPLTTGLEINAATAGEPVLILQTTDDNAANPILEIQNAAGAMLSEIEAAGNLNFVTALAANPGMVELNDARFLHTYGTRNLFMGLSAGNFALTGTDLVGVGLNALSSITSGIDNVGIGTDAGRRITSGDGNVFVGTFAGDSTTTSDYNFGLGRLALGANTTGIQNVALGQQALRDNITGTHNLAIGTNTLLKNQSGRFNVGVGAQSLHDTRTGSHNVAIGHNAGYGAGNNSFNNNTLVGSHAGFALTTGSTNVCIGYRTGAALTTGGTNVLIGYQAGDVLTVGGGNVIIGYNIDPTAAGINNELNIGALIYGALVTNRGGVNVTPPNLAATWHVDQPATDGAIPVLLLDQADLSEEFIEFTTTVGAGNPVDTAAHGAYYGKVRVMVTGVGYKVLALYEET